MNEDEAEWMGRYCDGHADAFRMLHARLAPRLLGYLMKMARDRAIAEDLVQVTFLKVHRARAAYVRGANPVPWIYAIAHRTFLDHARSKQRAKVAVTDDGRTPEVSADLDGTTEVARSAPTEPSELAKAALAALASLPPSQREAVILTKLDGKSIAEAATIAGTTPGAMKVRAHRGYEALRKMLATHPTGDAR